MAAAPPRLSVGAQAEISYLNGLTSSGTIAGTSFWTWNYNNPATYSNTSYAAKWGSPTPGTPGGTVTYWFDAASNWTAAEKAALESGLALWSAVANITFSLASSPVSGTVTPTSPNFIFYRGSDRLRLRDRLAINRDGRKRVDRQPCPVPEPTSRSTPAWPGFGPIGGSFGAYGGYP